MNTLTYKKVFNTFSVDDIDTAFNFYSTVLKLNVSRSPMNTLTLNIPGNENGMMIYEKENHEPASYTVLNLGVNDVDAAVDELTARGIIFEQYHSGGLKTDGKGISRDNGGPVIAWFKDPAGNFISVIETK